MIACMLTSLKVVSIAAVDWDCTKRSATRARSLDIRTRRSVRSARPPADGSRATGLAETGGGAGWEEGAGGAGGADGRGDGDDGGGADGTDGAALCSTYADT